MDRYISMRTPPSWSLLSKDTSPSSRATHRDAQRHAYFHEKPYPKEAGLMPTFPTRHEEMAVRERERERQQAKSATSMLLKDDFFQGGGGPRKMTMGGGGGAVSAAVRKKAKLG